MKRFVLAVAVFVALLTAWDFAHYRLGWYVDLDPGNEVEHAFEVRGDGFYRLGPDGAERFEVRGVNMGSGMPGEWSTDFAADKETYLRWFGQMQEMGANVLRVYTVQNTDFYEAFHEYNEGREEPLYLMHGVWVNDYIQNSHRDAYDPELLDKLLEDCRTAVDVIHGERKVSLGRAATTASGLYSKDVSPWVVGYILGVEWEDKTVAYTDEKYAGVEGYDAYSGEYLRTTPEATPFEAFLAQVGDRVVAYESQRYGQQRPVAFSNWPITDVFEYPEDVADFFMKCGSVDVEHIAATEDFPAGQFASYHVYPYYPDYLAYIDDWTPFGLDREAYALGDGRYNTYRAYLQMLNDHHAMPVVISEFGVSTGRGMAQRDRNTGRNQGNMSEQQQGEALVACWEDIQATGCAGGCVFSWQDEWFKRTWNTMYAVDLKRTPYWSDYQTNEQYFGLLSFDPGEEESVCYVDGDVSEWGEGDVVSSQDDIAVSMKYDEKFIYLRVHEDGLDFENETIFLPIDTTQKTGSTYCENFDVRFGRAADFLLVLDGAEGSRLLVQERSEALRSTYAQEEDGYDTYAADNVPDADSPRFESVDMILQTATTLLYDDPAARAENYETGRLTYGDANPAHEGFNSLADFICSGDDIEIKLPWQLLNFADPSSMEIHDDYYAGNYGVAYQTVDAMYVGAGTSATRGRIELSAMPLEGWGNDVTYHERLKSSYYIMRDLWAPAGAEGEG